MAADGPGLEGAAAPETSSAPDRDAALERPFGPAEVDQGQSLPNRSVAATPDPGLGYVAGTRPGPLAPDATGRSAGGAGPPYQLLEPAQRQHLAERARPELVDQVETMWYQHVLVDDPALAAASAARIEQTMTAWTTANLARMDESPDRAVPIVLSALPPAPADLDQRLGELAYRFVEVDDPYLAQLNLDTAASTVRDLSSTAVHDLAAEHDPTDPDLAAAQRWAFDHGLTPIPSLASEGPDIEPPALDGLALEF